MDTHGRLQFFDISIKPNKSQSYTPITAVLRLWISGYSQNKFRSRERCVRLLRLCLMEWSPG